MNSTTTDGVTETRFDLEVAGRAVPAVVWRPASVETAPLVLAGHGGGFGTNGHKQDPGIVRLAHQLATMHGIATVAIDQPGCGDREGAAEEQARRRGMSVEEAVASLWTKELVEELANDWQATIDHLVAQGLGTAAIGYWGLSGGTTFGLPFVASEPRVSAAILGLNGAVPLMHAYAGDVQCPVLYVMNMDDRFMTRESALALYDLLGTDDKRLWGFPGDHGQNLEQAVPGWARFLAERLT